MSAELEVGACEGERKTVLVVEDNEDDLFLFRRTVEKAGCGLSFHYVRDGEKAIAYLKGEEPYADRKAHPPPDLVMLDLGLPAEDGFGVLKWIRNGHGRKKLKVFVVSGWDEQVHVERAMRAGANRFIPKPMGATALQGVEAILEAVSSSND